MLQEMDSGNRVQFFKRTRKEDSERGLHTHSCWRSQLLALTHIFDNILCKKHKRDTVCYCNLLFIYNAAK